jgi:hypothetical protein
MAGGNTPVIGGNGPAPVAPSENANGNGSAQSLASQVLRLSQGQTPDYAYDPFYGSSNYSFNGLGGGAQVVPRAHLRDETSGWSKTDNLVKGTEHMNVFFKNWNTNAKWRLQLITLGLATGLLKKGWSSSDAQNVWDIAGQTSAQNYRTGAMKLTPMQTLQWYAGNAGKGLSNLNGLGAGNPTTSTDVHTNYQIEDPATAMAITQTVLQAALGRQPTPDEVSRYRNAIQSYDRAHPQVTTTTSNNVTGNSTSSTTGGVTSTGEQALVNSAAGNTAEGQAYQTNNVFNDAMKILAGL